MGLVFAGTGILGRLFLLCLCVLHSSLGHLFHTHEEKQSLGRVYGYFPPSSQSWFTISGDKVWLPLPPQDSGHRGALSELPVLIYCISQTMGKLGASLSSGHVLVNGTRRQVFLVGAPTHGMSRAMKLGCVLVRWLLDHILWGKVVKSGARQT